MSFVLTPEQIEQVNAMWSGESEDSMADLLRMSQYIAQAYTDYDLIQLILKGMVTWKYENGELVFGASDLGAKLVEAQKEQTRRAFGSFEQ